MYEYTIKHFMVLDNVKKYPNLYWTVIESEEQISSSQLISDEYLYSSKGNNNDFFTLETHMLKSTMTNILIMSVFNNLDILR